jgi:hypothetical protein
MMDTYIEKCSGAVLTTIPSFGNWDIREIHYYRSCAIIAITASE